MRIAHQIGNRLAEVGAAVDLQVQLGGVVAPLDAIAAIEDHHAVGQRLRRAPEARQRIAELLLAPLGGALVAMQRAQHLVPGTAAFRHLAGDRIVCPARKARQVVHVVEDEREQARGERRPAPCRTGNKTHKVGNAGAARESRQR